MLFSRRIEGGYVNSTLELERPATSIHKSWTQVVLGRQEVHTASFRHFAFTEIYFLPRFTGLVNARGNGNNVTHVKKYNVHGLSKVLSNNLHRC